MKENKKNKKGKNPKSIANLRNIDNNDPNINEAKSNGQIERSKNKNILYTARTLYENANILPEIISGLKKEVEEGILRNAIDFFKAIKENESQELKINGNVDVQKIFIDEKTKSETDKHIDNFINGQEN